MARGATRKVTVKFEAIGEKELIRAIKELTLASGVLTNKSKQIAAAMGLGEARMKSFTEKMVFGATTTRNMGGAFSVLRSKLLLVSFAFSMVGASVGRLSKSFAEQEAAEKKLEIQLGGVNRELLKFASQQQKVTRFGDEVTISAMATAGAYTTNTEQIKRLTEAAMDYAVFSGKDLNTAMAEVSRSIFSTTNMLTRQGIAFDGAVGTAARFNNAIDAIAKKTGGLAKGEAQTLEVSLIQMTNAVGDLAERIGKILAPRVQSIAKALTAFTETLNEGKIKAYGYAVSGLALAYGLASGAIQGAALATIKFVKANWMMLAAMVAVTAVIEILDRHFNFFGDDVDDLAKSIEELNKAMDASLKEEIDLMRVKQKHHNLNKNITTIQSMRNMLQVEHNILKKEELAGLLTSEQYKKRVLELDIKQLEIDKALANQRMTNWGKFNQQYSAALSSVEKLANTVDDANKKEELSHARTQRQKDAIEEKYQKKAEQRANQLKKWKIAAAISNVALGITQTWREAGMHPYEKIAMTALQAIAGGAAIAEIAAQKYQYGGMVGGRRHSQGGTIIEAEQGEFVMSRNAVDAIGIENLNRMNQGGGAPVNVTVTGNVMTQDFVEGELAEAIRKASSRGTDFGVS